MIQENQHTVNNNNNYNNSYFANIIRTANGSNGTSTPDMTMNSVYSYADSSGFSEPTSPIIPTIQHVQGEQERQMFYAQQVYATNDDEQQQHHFAAVTTNNNIAIDNTNINNEFANVCYNNNNNNNNNNNDNIINSTQLFDNVCDYAPQTNNADSISEAANNSDASTVDDLNADAEPAAPDEPFTYLQGLNSDNLMQFSQQTVIQELLIKECLDRKPNLDTLPTFEQHDYGGYNFHFKIHKQCKSKLNWVYSDKLNKVYIRMNQVFNVDAVFKPKMPMQQLRLRVFLCFVKEVSEPVLRCQNHISKDTESHVDLRPYLLRCENPFTEYCGKAEGRSINERYSVLVPLNMCITPQDDKTIKQTIALKFTCQNSCIGRKETSIVFLLEGMNGEVLAQRILDVKICSCPKRDRDLDEASKRKLEDDICPRQSKIRKRSTSSTQAEFIKEELSNSPEEFENEDSDDESVDFKVSTMPHSNGVRVVLDFTDKSYLSKVVDSIFTVFSDKWFPTPHCSKRMIRRGNKIRKMRDRALKLSK